MSEYHEMRAILVLTFWSSAIGVSSPLPVQAFELLARGLNGEETQTGDLAQIHRVIL